MDPVNFPTKNKEARDDEARLPKSPCISKAVRWMALRLSAFSGESELEDRLVATSPIN
jgi:hypothetical protein